MDQLLTLLPLLNLLALPAAVALWRLSGVLATLQANQTEHGRRLAALELFHNRHERARS